ncbi:MAG: hypothetical protein ACU0BF_10095 [Paracoccaceae bacterium]
MKPKLHFRTRDNGAMVYRVEMGGRDGRLDLDPLAQVILRKREVRVQGERELSADEAAAIEEWMDDRAGILRERRIDDIHRAIEHLNATAHWVQTQATTEEVDSFAEPLLMAMHDLRTTLVRRAAEGLTQTQGDQED